jgi:putative methionine-R-sulfoxide reductase with GAF domain
LSLPGGEDPIQFGTMAIGSEAVLRNIREIAVCGASRRERATAIADAIRNFGQYRWVGIYDVDAEFVSILAWSGSGPPAHPQFPVTKGLTGSAIAQKAIVLVGDVRKDPRYLTAFGSTLSEIIIPVVRARPNRRRHDRC